MTAAACSKSPGVPERFDRSGIPLTGERPSGQAIRGRAVVAAGHLGGDHVDDRLDADGPRDSADSEHLHDLHALKGHVRRDQVANRPDVGGSQIDRRQRARETARVVADEHLPLVVVVAGNLVGRREDVFHRRVEPVVDARANELAAGNQHEHGRHDGHAEQHGDELRAEPGERQRAAPLHDQLDDVAREDEDQRRQHRQVGRRQRVEDDLTEEIGREPRRAVGDGRDGDEDRDERGDAGQNEPGVVAKRPPARRRTRRRGSGAFRRDRR